MHEVERMKQEERTVVERQEAGQPEGESVVKGRPGRRTVEERQQAVLDLLAGKASVDQLARRLGVLPATVEG